MPKKLDIAVAYASIGSGHRVAAESIADALALGHLDVDVHVADILDFGTFEVDGDRTTHTFAGPFGPMYDAVWGSRSLGRFVWGSTGWISRAAYADFTTWLDDISADAVICTHAFAANIVAGSRIRLKRDIPLICVPTDYGVHGFWPHRHVDLVCVGVEQMRPGLLNLGIADERIAVTGIPTRDGFGEHHDKAALRAEFGLPATGTIALILAGASMSGPYARLKKLVSRSLNELCATEDITIVVVTGSDAEYAERLEDHARLDHLDNLLVLSYVSGMDRLMAASDLIVCKPGGLTCTESVCSDVPMILAGPAVGQERANVEFLTHIGAAVHVDDDEELARAFRSLVRDSERLGRMRQAATTISHPDAARNIADHAVRLAREKQNKLEPLSSPQ